MAEGQPEDIKKRPAEEVPEIEPKKFDRKGVAPIKAEYRLQNQTAIEEIDDDEFEQGTGGVDPGTMGAGGKGRHKRGGQNKKRYLVQSRDQIKLCSCVMDPENPEMACKYPEGKCKFSHDTEAFLAQKEPDLPGKCPAWEDLGYCPTGIKCRWLGSHWDPEAKKLTYREGYNRLTHCGEVNWAPNPAKTQLKKRQMDLSKSDEVANWIDREYKGKTPDMIAKEEKSNAYVEPPFKPEEKKKLYLNDAKIVAPLTTVGNLPYRRLMKTLGADVTYSEMAITLPIIQGSKREWALMKAHQSECPGFGVQIATAKTWQAAKAVEAICKLTPNVSEFNLNCGCPIDMLYRHGEGSALMENSNRTIRLLKAMNYTSSDIPVTVKLRMGVKDEKPLAISLTRRILEERDTAAITVHGRSRKQRYTKEANWDYIGEVGQVVKDWNENQEEDKDARDPAAPVYLIGNGDCFTYEDWNSAVARPGVDSVMVGRGSLIKPWIFEEVKTQQYLDKSATERLRYLEDYSKFALEHWGSDEYGVNTARRYMCEFISFTHRYIPVGILERLPPKLNERPPPWKGRNELETLLGSPDYKDWIKITEMFLGPAGDGFQFIPKHKSNSFEE